jgi:hypothetical protein
MTGYERSPDYGGPRPHWGEAGWIIGAFAVVVLMGWLLTYL